MWHSNGVLSGANAWVCNKELRVNLNGNDNDNDVIDYVDYDAKYYELQLHWLDIKILVYFVHNNLNRNPE